MSDTVLEIVQLGEPPWPTTDPFLFFVHHHDDYPPGNGAFGPAASLAGRRLGNDFAGIDGWRMYHGATVPGFPQHPHRGFETVTIARHGLIDHSDSLGAAARFGEGDVQWMTAGRGIVHAEMFPLLDETQNNRAELFQIWLNLPRKSKMVDPHFTMLWNDELPRIVDGPPGAGATITVIAGAIGDHVPPPPPPDSWAADPENEVAIWAIQLDAGATWQMPAARHSDINRTIYVFVGDAAHLDDTVVAVGHAAIVQADRELTVRAGAEPVELLVLQGRPINEPVAQYGPFVMNDRAGVQRAIEDYQRTAFGGWPWPSDDPVHGAEPRRFARHADGRIEEGSRLTRQ